MTEQHPITPPDELVQQWREKWKKEIKDNAITPGIQVSDYIATQAARWGADQQLRAVCKWLAQETPLPYIAALRAAMRPKPPRLALRALIEFESHQCAMETNGCDTDLLRAALERLQQLELEGNG